MSTTVTRDTSRPIRPVPAGCGQQRWPERRSSVEACAEEGGIHADTKPTLQPAPLLGVLLVLTGWPLVAALVALLLFIIEHMPAIAG